MNDLGTCAEMGTSPPEPYYSTSSYPLELWNIVAIYQAATKSKTLTDLEKDLDSLLAPILERPCQQTKWTPIRDTETSSIMTLS